MSDTVTGAGQENPDDAAAIEAAESAAWDELEAAEASDTAGDRNPDEGAGQAGDNPDDDEDTSGQSDAGSKAAGGSDDGGAARAQPGADGAGTAKKPDDEKPDPWANAPEELRTLRNAEIEERDRRIKGLDQKLGRTIAALQTAKAQQGAAAPAAKAGTAGSRAKPDGSSGTGSGAFDSESFRRLAEDYPDLAGPIREVMEAQAAQIQSLTNQLGQMSAEDLNAAMEKNEEILAQDHPDFLDITATRQFHDWAKQQPLFVQEGLKRNHDSIVDPAEASKILSMFKAEAGIATGAAAGAARAGDGKGTGATTPGRRQRQQDAANTSRSSGPRTVVGEPPADADEDQLWDYFEQLDRKRAAAR